MLYKGAMVFKDGDTLDVAKTTLGYDKESNYVLFEYKHARLKLYNEQFNIVVTVEVGSKSRVTR